MATKITILDNPTSPIAIGEWFLCDGHLCHLVQVAAGCVCLVNIQSGNRKREHLKVLDVGNITNHEFLQITGKSKATRVNVEILVKPL